MISVLPGTVAVYADLACPWAHVAVQRLWRTRAELGLDEVVRFDHRAVLLEVINRGSLPKPVIDAEIPVTAEMEPDAGWRLWAEPDWRWPVSRLLAAEAVQAAKEQGLAASEALDRALRRAFFADNACITMRHVVLDVAESSPSVDAAAVGEALDAGRARAATIAQVDDFVSGGVITSPHLFTPDGGSWPNPGVDYQWAGQPGTSPVVLKADDPSVYRRILTRAAEHARE
ncbi:DsbA family oxidoreductase [Streptomyces dysideae]|nr:DsbA family protein [Streptomyces dysideae]